VTANPDTTPIVESDLRSWLLEQGFPAGGYEATVANGTTPLMRASHLGNVPIAQALIRSGAQLNVLNADGNNALWLACVGRRPEVIALLISAGIDIDNRNDNQATCLMYAASTGSAAVLEQLLAAGADLHHETLDGFTALDMASTLDCLSLLRRAAKRERAAC
jgi:thiosulfate/3-mercaptopyruvate sulfurtransferase